MAENDVDADAKDCAKAALLLLPEAENVWTRAHTQMHTRVRAHAITCKCAKQNEHNTQHTTHNTQHTTPNTCNAGSQV